MESQLNLDKPRKLVKMKNRHNSYLIKDVWFDDADKDIILVFGFVILLSVIF